MSERRSSVTEQAEILAVDEEHLPALAELAAVIWRSHYPGIITPAQIEYMLERMYSIETMRREIRTEGINYYRLIMKKPFSRPHFAPARYRDEPQPEPTGSISQRKTTLSPSDGERDVVRGDSVDDQRSNMMSGFASIGPAGEGVMKLHKLYVLPELQGRGLGSRLLRHCENEAARLGASRLILAVNKRNTKAIAAYERNGYKVIESVVNDIGGGFVMDDFVMGKGLP